MLAIVLCWYALEHSIKAITVDAAGLHARHGLGTTTRLLWERISDFYGGGRYGLPLTLISSDVRLVLHRRLADWPELYALVQRARPELWTTLDPSRLESPVHRFLVVVLLLQLPNAVFLTARSPFWWGVVLLLAAALVANLFYDPRSITLSDDGLHVKYPLHSGFVLRSDIGGFVSVERPYWRRG